jgi:hypothetical protein
MGGEVINGRFFLSLHHRFQKKEELSIIPVSYPIIGILFVVENNSVGGWLG